MRALWLTQINNPWRDYIAALLLMGALVAVDRFVVSIFPLDLDDFSRRAVYQTLATLSGTLLGLTLTAISVLYNVLSQGTPLLDRALGANRKAATIDLFMSTVRGLFLGFVVFLFALMADSGQSGVVSVQIIALGMLGFVLVRVGRVVYLLSTLLDIAARG